MSLETFSPCAIVADRNRHCRVSPQQTNVCPFLQAWLLFCTLAYACSTDSQCNFHLFLVDPLNHSQTICTCTHWREVHSGGRLNALFDSLTTVFKSRKVKYLLFSSGARKQHLKSDKITIKLVFLGAESSQAFPALYYIVPFGVFSSFKINHSYSTIHNL